MGDWSRNNERVRGSKSCGVKEGEVSWQRGKVKDRGRDGRGGKVIGTWADWSRFRRFTQVDTMPYWLVGGPKGKRSGRKGKQCGARLNEKEVQTAGVTIVFAECGREWREGGIKFM